ncbi:hypothetical protein BT96DRAFT_982424 [Gymnopus androsaceus JB14]|uniref:Uncharacterized protein n=1 Tax=Gymnopus androsaceus JB14 TaxID=1447944 RepID=A0A6A4GE80_9AGAR|nr:hypothetical protein BT96DRAFT_982424 [Gymnopus androsaceus JB14]
MSTTIFASDPSITYSPQSAWSPNSDGTMTTNNIGASAQLTFNGEFVEVFGTIPPTSKRDTTRPVSNYTLDHATSVVFNTSDFTNNQPITNHVFYQSPGLANGSHSLVITAIATDHQADFVLASIVYDSNFSLSNPIPSSSESIPESTPTSFPSSSQPAVSAVGTPAHKTPVGAIVGGVIAGLVLLAAVIAFLVIRRRRKQRTAIHRAPTPFSHQATELKIRTGC